MSETEKNNSYIYDNNGGYFKSLDLGLGSTVTNGATAKDWSTANLGVGDLTGTATSAFTDKGPDFSSMTDDQFNGWALMNGKEPMKTFRYGYKDNDTSWFNSGNIAAAAGLASALTQAIALPEQLKNMRTQRKSMEHNLATAKEEQARRNKNISGFNNFKNIKGA